MSGIRGIFGKDLTLRDVLKFSKNFSVLINSKKCVIATDTRPSGHMITETVKAGLMQSGIDVYDLGIAPTPVAFRESRKYGAGIIVTSSHNPIEWNGLKMVIDGKGINEKQLDTIINEQNPSKSKIGVEYKIESDYIDDAAKIIGKIPDIPKVSVDIGGGAAKKFASQLLEKVGCDVVTINNELEKSSRGPDPTVDTLEELVTNTKNRDIGFAFDLDEGRSQGEEAGGDQDGKESTRPGAPGNPPAKDEPCRFVAASPPALTGFALHPSCYSPGLAGGSSNFRMPASSTGNLPPK